MEDGLIQIYYGEGAGKTSAALGHAIRCAGRGGTVYFVRFLKEQMNSEFYERLEPELKFFRFERSPAKYEDQTEEQHIEEKKHLQNGINFARKVMMTDECDMLILDEVLGAIEAGMVEEVELLAALEAHHTSMRVILTGRGLTEAIAKKADSILNITKEK